MFDFIYLLKPKTLASKLTMQKFCNFQPFICRWSKQIKEKIDNWKDNEISEPEDMNKNGYLDTMDTIVNSNLYCKYFSNSA